MSSQYFKQDGVFEKVSQLLSNVSNITENVYIAMAMQRTFPSCLASIRCIQISYYGFDLFVMT